MTFVYIGTIPSSIGSLTSLVNAQLNNNKLTGMYVIKLLWVHTMICPHFNLYVYKGTIPSNIGSLTLLIDLELNNNNLTGIGFTILHPVRCES